MKLNKAKATLSLLLTFIVCSSLKAETFELEAYTIAYNQTKVYEIGTERSYHFVRKVNDKPIFGIECTYSNDPKQYTDSKETWNAQCGFGIGWEVNIGSLPPAGSYDSYRVMVYCGPFFHAEMSYVDIQKMSDETLLLSVAIDVPEKILITKFRNDGLTCVVGRGREQNKIKIHKSFIRGFLDRIQDLTKNKKKK